jgi:hypothetical protein
LLLGLQRLGHSEKTHCQFFDHRPAVSASPCPHSKSK